jgi:hypothetical protein
VCHVCIKTDEVWTSADVYYYMRRLLEVKLPQNPINFVPTICKSKYLLYVDIIEDNIFKFYIVYC